MRKLPVVILLLALAAAVGGWVLQRALQPPSPSMLAPAPQAPAFAAGALRPDPLLTDLAGKPVRLDQWQGKWLLLNFWAPWCPPCREELPVLRALQQRAGSRGLQVIGIAEDTPAAVRAFLKTTPLDYPALLPGDDHPGLAFGNTRQGLPYSVLIAPDGRMLKRHYGAFTAAELQAWLPPALQ
ncbi:MAG: TlpA family protein disulfide reductase [Metallibacterium scheffleri]|jgi:thiol-disulfide isomerase/thioredoxin|uniref:TlpA family protein disulfide reductase n=1 Tax=Metallibacterium scheffleri TaxID=993689 RepID=UPI0026EEE549|nr:TlpA disulfide reductase family protein [Metallibacterium scheffleri]MCK9366650.1 TlpA family protein disulfide reductase [Metallibacterium scheffleri]